MAPQGHSYRQLIQKIKVLADSKGFKINYLGHVSGYRLVWLEKGWDKQKAPYAVHLTAGIHGDEPAGVLGLLGFLEKMPRRSLEQIDLSVFPCVNAWGYEYSVRENELGQDINRAFKRGTNCAEVKMMMEVWKGRQYDVLITCHEDYDAPGAYLYELKKSPPFWGDSILEGFARYLPIDHRRQIEGQPAKNGLIRRRLHHLPRNLYPEAIYMVKGKKAQTRHTLTFETPSLCPLEKRIAAQIAGLKKSFKLLMENK